MSRLSPLNRKGPRQRLQTGWTFNPVGFAICDGCGLPTMYNTLRPHMQYRGGLTPEADGLMVCARCDDVPQPYFQLQVLAPDPVPLQNPRPDDPGPQCGNIELENDDGEVELEDGDGVVALECMEYPEYPTGSLPDPYGFAAGTQINVMGLIDSPVRAYSDTINWRRVETDAVIT